MFDEDGSERMLFETEVIDMPAMPVLLSQNRPNPFNPSTTIEYFIPAPSPVTLDIFDVGGRLVRRLVSARIEAGSHKVRWDGTAGDGSPAASGVYFYRLTAGREKLTGKMVLPR